MNELQPISDKQLKRGYFWLLHKGKLRKVFFITFFVILAIIYYFLITNFINFILQPSWQQTSSSLSSVFDWQAYHAQHRPQTLQISRAQYFPVGGNRYNLAAFIQNPNPDWLVSEFEYQFVVNGQPLELETGWLNPEDNKMMLKFGYESPAGIRSIEIKLTNDIKWYKLNADTPRLTWAIDNIKYQPATTQEIGGQTVRLEPRLTWQATNQSFYNFWAVSFQVGLYNKDQLVAVNRIQADDWQGAATRDLEAIWLQDLGRVTNYVVIPEINWLDSDNFKDIDIPTSGKERVNL